MWIEPEKSSCLLIAGSDILVFRGMMKKKSQLKMKRIIDIILSFILIIVFTPIMIIIGMMIAFFLGFPVLFFQERLGYQGKPFTIIKFRTMNYQKDQQGHLHPIEQRLTNFGKFLRSTTLDELPELFNVLKGEMSLVGPRPLLVDYRDLYNENQWRRHEMPPGMAGPVPAQGRDALSWEEKFQWDVMYVDNWSLLLDVKLLFQSFRIVISRMRSNSDEYFVMPRFTGSGKVVQIDRKE